MSLRRLAIVSCMLAGCGTSPEAHYQKGRLLLKQGKVVEAMREAESGFRAEPSWRFRILKADTLMARSDFEGAKALLAYPAPPSDQESLGRLRMDQGWLEFRAAQYSSAEALLQQALSIAKTTGQTLLEAGIEGRLGLVEGQQGRLDAAEETLRHAIHTATEEHDPYLQAGAMCNLGVVYLNAFRLEDAIYWLNKAAPTFQQIGLTDYYYIALADLGSCYQQLGDFDQALADYREAEEHARLIGDRYSEQHWIGNSGEVLSDLGEFQRAAQRFQQALAIAKPSGKPEMDSTGWWYYNLASLSIELGDYEKADFYNKEALSRRLAIGDRSDFYPRVNEAMIAAGRKDPRAESLYRGLIEESYKDPAQMLEAQAGLAGLLADKGEYDRADAQFRAALADLETQRIALTSADNRMSYLASLIRFYDHYINFLVDQKQPDRALEVAESSRARVLDEKLESKSPRAEVSAARIRELARSSHSVFLSYWLGNNRSFLWAVTPDGIAIKELPAEKKISALVAEYRSFIENLRDPLQSEYPAGRKLSETLLQPVIEQIRSAERLVLVPDRSLNALNFETLPDPSNPSKYFIESATIEVVPSLDMVAERRTASTAPDSLLLIGDPDQVVEEYPKLPFAATEIAKISKSFSPREEKIIEGADASPSAYRAARPAQFGWIHFAAHASPNQTSPLDSSLILSRGANAYQLSARDVMAVPLNAKLVTLSACRSAAAKTYSGEGPVGLSWAFLRAGARSVVAGLWDVTDRSTAAVMADFYDQLAQHATPADALRHAKLTLLHGAQPYKKPFYWGPFQLYAGAI